MRTTDDVSPGIETLPCQLIDVNRMIPLGDLNQMNVQRAQTAILNL